MPATPSKFVDTAIDIRCMGLDITGYCKNWQTHSDYVKESKQVASVCYLAFTEWCEKWMENKKRINPLFQAIRDDNCDVVCFFMERPEIYWGLFPFIRYPCNGHDMMEFPSYQEAAEDACWHGSFYTLKYLVAAMLTTSTRLKYKPSTVLLTSAIACQDTRRLECVKYILSIPEIPLAQMHFNACYYDYPRDVDLMRMLLEDGRINPFKTGKHEFEMTLMDDRVSQELVKLVCSDQRFELADMQYVVDEYKRKGIETNNLGILKEEICNRKKASE